MADVSTLLLLLEQAERTRDEALVLLQQAQQRANLAHAQHKDLGDYQQQHDRRWIDQFRDGAAVQIVQAHQQFGLRLSDAICQQAGMATQMEARLQTARLQLQEREMKVASVRKLIERRQAEAMTRQMRAEQKLSDEFAAQRARQNLR
jgi:flagellar protein FliJ